MGHLHRFKEFHAKHGWQAWAVIIAVPALLVGVLAWQFPRSPAGDAATDSGSATTDLTTTVLTSTAPTSSLPTTVVTTTPVGNCTDLYFEQDPEIPHPVIHQLPEGVTAERLNPGLSKYPVGGLLLRDRRPLGAIKFFYEDPGVGFSVINVVDATCAPVQVTSRKVATDTYVAAFRLGTDDFELVVKLNGLADVTFRRP